VCKDGFGGNRLPEVPRLVGRRFFAIWATQVNPKLTPRPSRSPAGIADNDNADGFLFREMRREDVEAAIGIMVAAEAATPVSHPVPRPDVTFRARRVAILSSLIGKPGAYAVVAESRGRIVGQALALRDGPLWGLSLLFVDPALHGRRIGSTLLRMCRVWGADAGLGLIESSADQKAMRAYSALGFSFTPAMGAAGIVDPTLLRPTPQVRKAGKEKLEGVASVDRRLRGASRAAGVEILLNNGAELLWAEDKDAAGFAVHLSGRPFIDGSPIILGADTRELAEQLLTAFLRATTGNHVAIYSMSARQDWALKLTMQAGLTLFPMAPTFSQGYDQLPEFWLMSGVFF
jgi:GNAT superfamily N-acetyltransferase